MAAVVSLRLSLKFKFAVVVLWLEMKEEEQLAAQFGHGVLANRDYLSFRVTLLL